jgi:hypothetical protein
MSFHRCHTWRRLHVGVGSNKHHLGGRGLMFLLRLTLVTQGHLKEVEYSLLLTRGQQSVAPTAASSLVLRRLKHSIIAPFEVVGGLDGPAASVQGSRVKLVRGSALCDIRWAG